ncbi:hypothetical protein PAXRUDRAFT_828713 [Paxillus rubicundulus Ve08.2h10]|uniref:Uncharacterized protein n=1 Tax=Paxillus rubicundulus Ve08.2h10 TaxID=930991 RepID=A0A0D0E741_9AGAM|nr:hypothetical protein PAXRUDRAFT_828713 [Paxillus rubicundulus Ve08.2h10]
MFPKDMYSVFRYSPLRSIGFAALSETALGMNGVNGPPPTTIIGSISATVTTASNRASIKRSPNWRELVVVFWIAAGAALL